MDKNSLRHTMAARRDSLEAAARILAGRHLLEKLKEMKEFQDSKWIYLYASYGSEVPAWEVLDYCLATRKKTALPRVLDRGKMEFYQISKREDLKEGFRGILEPQAGCPLVREAGLMILPGLAFDNKGGRLGYGGGYYDRYLSMKGDEHYIKIGACYTFQIIPSVPQDALDVKLDFILDL